MTQNSWKILVTKSIDDAMHCYFFKKKCQKGGQIPVLGKPTHMWSWLKCVCPPFMPIIYFKCPLAQLSILIGCFTINKEKTDVASLFAFFNMNNQIQRVLFNKAA